MAIVKRLVVGRALTHAELDGNFDQLVSDIGAVLPSQTGNANKFLKTNGTTVSWADAGGGSNSIITATASRDATLSDNGAIIRCDHATTAIDITINTDATASWVGGEIISIFQYGAAFADIKFAGGVTPVGTKPGISRYNGILSVMKIGANEWMWL